ncbi:hypothetical protein IMSAG192_00564 [Muribaculaceae bacterium]|nr:hypothetical protein IMSAG192_00564 [Muribaculaceae bacterium]
MACLSDFTCRTHEVILAEKLTGLHTQLSTDYFLVQTVVTVDDYIVDCSLRALYHSHFESNRVAGHILFNRIQVIEQISVVEIKVAHGILILYRTLVEQFLVVDIAGTDVKYALKNLGGIYSIAHPVDIADVVFLSFFEVYIDIDILVVVLDNAVADNLGIAVAFLVVFGDNPVKVVPIIAFNEFLLTEEVDELALLVGLLHRTLQHIVREHLVAVDVYLVHLYLRVFVDIDIDYILVGS